MSEALDRMFREIEDLRRIINAQQSGLPSHLGVIVHSDDPRLIEAAKMARLAPYGLSTAEEAREAGCEVSVLCLPYCEGRTVDKTDPTEAVSLVNAGKGDCAQSVGASVGIPDTHPETHINKGAYTDNRSVCVPPEAN